MGEIVCMKHIIYLFAFSLSLGTVWGQDSAEALVSQSFLPEIVNIIGMVAGLAVTFVLKLAAQRLRKMGMEEEVIDSLSSSVTNIYHTVYKDLKEKAADKKITKEEAAHLRQIAFDGALKELNGAPKKFLIKKSKEWVNGKIEDIITAKKGK